MTTLFWEGGGDGTTSADLSFSKRWGRPGRKEERKRVHLFPIVSGRVSSFPHGLAAEDRRRKFATSERGELAKAERLLAREHIR